MKKILIIIFCIISLINVKAQSKNNIKDIFIMQLFLNKKNSNIGNTSPSIIKNDSLFDVFKEILDIKIDTLKINNSLTGVLENEYKFFRLDEKNVNYNPKFNLNEHRYLLLDVMINTYYVLAVNTKTGASYRLSGFDTNDFLGFLNDFKEEYLNSNFIKLKNSMFLKKFRVEYLDFKCLYEGLNSKKRDREKYECLKRCSDPLKIY